MLPEYSDEEMSALAQRIGLTLEQLRNLHKAAHATYQTIGGDFGGNLKREVLVEAVMDANYMEAFGSHYLTPELIQWINRVASTYELDWVYEAMGAGFRYPMYE